jgi:hypothetical protein
MGPWFIRDTATPFRPGCSYATLRALVQRGRVITTSVIRGPSTRQFWMHARNVPGVAHLLGECHACHSPARPDAVLCTQCGTSFVPESDRQYLGLAEVRLLPGQAPAAAVARSASGAPAVPAPRPPSAFARAPHPAETDDLALAPPDEEPAAPAAPIETPAPDLYTGRPLSPAYDPGPAADYVPRPRGARVADRQRTVILVLIVSASLAVLGVLALIIAAATGQFSRAPATAPTTPPTPAAATPAPTTPVPTAPAPRSTAR